VIESLNGKVALVTGGTRGIGAAIARRLLAAGCEVVTCGRTEPEHLPEAGGRAASFHACDIRQADQAGTLVDAVIEQHGRLDLLVNNAGGSPQAQAASASPRFSEAIVALNLLAPLHVSQAAYPHLRDAGGSIVNIASVAAERPSPGTAIYGAAKAGLLSLTKSLAQEWGPEIRVNAIVVGLIETETAEQTRSRPMARNARRTVSPLRCRFAGSAAATMLPRQWHSSLPRWRPMSAARSSPSMAAGNGRCSWISLPRKQNRRPRAKGNEGGPPPNSRANHAC
jgi:NAD(P)-dependent dehydrogenase (short-subunit alcohol dehydrogenase family)